MTSATVALDSTIENTGRGAHLRGVEASRGGATYELQSLPNGSLNGPPHEGTRPQALRMGERAAGFDIPTETQKSLASSRHRDSNRGSRPYERARLRVASRRLSMKSGEDSLCNHG